MRLQDELGARIVVPIVAAAVLVGALLGTFVAADRGKPPAQTDSVSQVAVRDLSAMRATERDQLARAATPEAQQAAAEELRRTHLRAADEIGAGDGALVAALRGAAAAYGDLARAARSDDAAAYARAARTVTGAEVRLEAALRAPQS